METNFKSYVGTKILLADDGYFHGYAAFFGGTEKAPARLRLAIFVSS